MPSSGTLTAVSSKDASEDLACLSVVAAVLGLALHQAASQGRVQVERAADVVRLADRRAG